MSDNNRTQYYDPQSEMRNRKYMQEKAGLGSRGYTTAKAQDANNSMQLDPLVRTSYLPEDNQTNLNMGADERNQNWPVSKSKRPRTK